MPALPCTVVDSQMPDPFVLGVGSHVSSRVSLLNLLTVLTKAVLLLPTQLVQALKNGYQQELPDIWLTNGNPWEVRRDDVRFEVGFGGRVDRRTEAGREVSVWAPSEKVRRGAGSGRGRGRSCEWAWKMMSCLGVRAVQNVLFFFSLLATPRVKVSVGSSGSRGANGRPRCIHEAHSVPCRESILGRIARCKVACVLRSR